MIALQKPVSHPVICSQCLLLAYWPVSAMGAISTGSTWRRSLEINCAMVSGHAILAETCTPPFICSQRFLSAYIPDPARDTWSTWRKSLVSWHDSLAETCFSFRYLQPVPPVGLLTGFSNGCNFYWEYVGGAWRLNCAMVSGHAILAKPVLLPLSAASASCRPISRIQQGILGVRAERAWWVDMIALQKPVSHPVICSQCLLLAHLPVSAMGAISTGSTWRRSLEINCSMVSGHAILAETCTPPLSAASASCRPISRIQQGILWVHRGRGLVSRHDSLAETCFSSRYL